MKASQEFLKTKGLFPKISFKDRQPHTVKLGSDKIESFKNEDGELVEGVKFLVSEAGQKRTFFTASATLISTLSQYEPNDVVTIQMKSRKGPDGVFKSYFEVTETAPNEPEPASKATDGDEFEITEELDMGEDPPF